MSWRIRFQPPIATRPEPRTSNDSIYLGALRHWLTGIATLIFAATLAGCASLGGPSASAPTSVSAGATTVVANYQNQISISGRLSVIYQQNGREQGLHGSFDWIQTSSDATQITLRSPLGQIIATIDVTPTLSTLIEANRAPQGASDVDTLAQQALGWPLPVSGLRQWLQGFTLNANGQLQPVARQADTSINTDGWQIRYVDWQVDDTGSSHPKRIDLTRTTADAGPVSIRIAIDMWQTP
ncbi:MAG: lipoprotein insertase outer membrane protein LolB [Herbaspirillum sp.]